MDTGTWGLYYNYTWWGNAIQTAPSVIGKPDFFGSQFEMLTSQQPNQVVNGDFVTDSDWNKTGTWVISNGTATSTGNGSTQYIGQNPNINIGTSYKISYNVISNTLSADRLLMSGTSAFASIQIPSAIGHNSTILEANSVASSGYSIRFANSATNTSGSITIDNISVQIVRADNVEAVKCIADWIHETQILDV